MEFPLFFFWPFYTFMEPNCTRNSMWAWAGRPLGNLETRTRTRSFHSDRYMDTICRTVWYYMCVSIWYNITTWIRVVIHKNTFHSVSDKPSYSLHTTQYYRCHVRDCRLSGKVRHRMSPSTEIKAPWLWKQLIANEGMSWFRGRGRKGRDVILS